MQPTQIKINWSTVPVPVVRTIAAVAAEYISSSSQVYGGSGFVESVLFKSELFLGLVLGISRNYGSLFSPNNT